jgi:hypothetical protein
MISEMVITDGIEQLNAVIGRQPQQPCLAAFSSQRLISTYFP